MAAARSRLALREEAVADPPDGEEVARVGRILLEALAEPQDEVVDRAGRGKDVIAPHPLEQVLARDDLAGVLREHLQHQSPSHGCHTSAHHTAHINRSTYQTRTRPSNA